MIYGGSTPVGCILIQLIKLWGGHVSAICRVDAAKVIRALGADDIIPIDECDLEKELELHDRWNSKKLYFLVNHKFNINGKIWVFFGRYHAVFYTDHQPIDPRILKKRLLPYGAFVSTLPQPLTSDSLGFGFGSLFAAHVRLKLLIQVRKTFVIDKLILGLYPLLIYLMICMIIYCSTFLELILINISTARRSNPQHWRLFVN